MDISPELLEQIQEDFERRVADNKTIAALLKKLEDGTATYKDADEYAVEIGDSLARAYQSAITTEALPNGRMYYNIANAVVRPTLETDHDIIADYAVAVQDTINKGAGLGLKAIRPEVDQNRIQGLLDRLTEGEDYDAVSWLLGEPVRNFSQNVVDDCVRYNADYQAKSGLSPKIVRTAEPGGTRTIKRGKRSYTYRVPCDWCIDLAGTYEYSPKMPRDVFRRHEGCRCNVEYSPDGVKRQNVWSKKWQSEEELEARRLRGLNTDTPTPEERIAKTEYKSFDRPVYLDEAQPAISWDVNVNSGNQWAIDAYTAGGGEFSYENINGYLNGTVQLEGDALKDMEACIRDIDSALNHATSEGFYVYRGIGIAPGKISVGDIIANNGYTSTSITKEIADDFTREYNGTTIKIKVPPGVKALNIGHHTPGDFNEMEVLLARGANIRIIEVGDEVIGEVVL